MTLTTGGGGCDRNGRFELHPSALILLSREQIRAFDPRAVDLAEFLKPNDGFDRRTVFEMTKVTSRKLLHCSVEGWSINQRVQR